MTQMTLRVYRINAKTGERTEVSYREVNTDSRDWLEPLPGSFPPCECKRCLEEPRRGPDPPLTTPA